MNINYDNEYSKLIIDDVLEFLNASKNGKVYINDKLANPNDILTFTMKIIKDDISYSIETDVDNTTYIEYYTIYDD